MVGALDGIERARGGDTGDSEPVRSDGPGRGGKALCDATAVGWRGNPAGWSNPFPVSGTLTASTSWLAL